LPGARPKHLFATVAAALLAAAALAVLTAAAPASTARAAAPAPASTARAAAPAPAPREPFFPRSGSDDYDVLHYDVRLAYRPRSGRVNATTTIDATAARRLPRFSLDLFGLEVTDVTVDGRKAGFSRGRGKLKVTPSEPVASGAAFSVSVTYRGRPRQVIDPDGSAEGWYRTNDGALAVGEPIGTAAWLPCDDTPADKAAFDFHLTVPGQLKAVANGRLAGVTRGSARTTYDWRESQPMAPYLAVIDVGRGRLLHSEADGLPYWTLVDPRMAKASGPALRSLPDVLRFESSIFGPYPFDAAGSIVDLAGFGYALETQTRPIYAFVPDRTTVVHETAHQWFGDSVGLERWPDIWLNEGFATWTQWYYAERHGGRSARQVFRGLSRVPASETNLWDPPPGRPGSAEKLFAPSTYVRGAMALEALRIKIGTKTLLKVIRLWATEHRYGNADIGQFVALAEEVSGRRLDSLFQRWLYRPGKPA
jgi:aminopeptidase N